MNIEIDMNDNKLKILVWLRQDLRLKDNPALYYAAQEGEVLPVFIWDETIAANYQPGSASQYWLHHALVNLKNCLEGRLLVMQGEPLELLERCIKDYAIDAVYWNRLYEPHLVERDRHIKSKLQKIGMPVSSFQAHLLWEPWEVLKADGTPYRVFTPFYKQTCRLDGPEQPLSVPESLQLTKLQDSSPAIDTLGLLPHHNWPNKLDSHWTISEQGGHNQLQHFSEYGLADYQTARDRPDQSGVSCLSPYLHWGQLSARQINYAVSQQPSSDSQIAYQRQLVWREFCHHLLYYFPSLPHDNFQTKFNQFPWRDDDEALSRWQMGQTGIPIVDAGMRQLWQTGYMHNRLRMVVGSFLTKNLMLHWHHGELWFWDTLVDADLANNSVGWQWIAGTGIDAAPYFRIFNPITQGEKFDPEGIFVKHYVPELEALSKRYLMKPWQAPQKELDQAGVQLGKDYPYPIVDLKESRQRALAAFKQLS